MKHLIALLLAQVLPLIVLGQQPQTSTAAEWTHDTGEGRPMLEAVRKVQAELGWLINYEDAQVDAAHVRPNGAPSDGKMHFSLPTAQIAALKADSHAERFALVQSLVSQHNAQTKLGDRPFHAEFQGARTFIGPGAPQPAGSFATKTPYASPLETPVTIKAAADYQNLAMELQDIILQVSTARRIGMSLGSFPPNIMLNQKPRFDIEPGSTARRAIEGVLAEFNGSPNYGVFSPSGNWFGIPNRRASFSTWAPSRIVQSRRHRFRHRQQEPQRAAL